MINTLFIFLLISSSFALQSMELNSKLETKPHIDHAKFTQDISIHPEKHTKSFVKSSSFPHSKKSSERLVKRKSLTKIQKPSSSPEKCIHEDNIVPLEHPCIIAAQNKNYDTIKFYLSNPHFNLNKYNIPQTFIRANDHKGIDILLEDPRTDFSQKDFEYKCAHHYIDRMDTNLSELRRKLFARFTLDMTTNKVCNNIRPWHDKDLMTKEIIINMIQKIKNNISYDETNQGDSELPQETSLPDYATDEFMTTKIWFILSIMQKS